MKFLTKTILLFILIQSALYAQDTSIIKYFPLNDGNKWVYNRILYSYPGSGKDVSVIESTYVTGNHSYFVFRNTMYLWDGTIYTSTVSSLRIDSLSGNIYSRDNTGECLADSLKSQVGDTAFSCVAWGPTAWFRCSDTNTYSVFGQNPKSKNFVMLNGFESSMTRRYAKNFGIVYKSEGAVMYNQSDYLKGCYISGVLYGDTTIVGIYSNSSEVPGIFSLFQNYPNPFNPVTQIEFFILKIGFVKLMVYDAGGRKISTLINKFLYPCNYDVKWDGKNYASGLYFYKLITDEFVETKKMVLVK